MEEMLEMVGFDPIEPDAPENEVTKDMRAQAIAQLRSRMGQPSGPKMQDSYSPQEMMQREADFNRNAAASKSSRIDPEAVPSSPTTGRMEDTVDVTKPMFPYGSDENVVDAKKYMSRDPAEEIVRRMIHRFR